MSDSTPTKGVWPKLLPPLTAEQVEISHDFMRHWHNVLPRYFSVVDWFNHSYAARATAPTSHCRTLEIGAGLGEHLLYERLDNQEYHCLEMRENMAADIRERFPAVKVAVGDCQARLPFPDGYFDRILAVHVLEHLPNLPAALEEAHRLLAPGGEFGIVIPCDPGWLYSLARKVSAEWIFRKRYGQSYDWFIRREHLNSPKEIIDLLRRQFVVGKRLYFPLLIPAINLNLCLGLVARKKPTNGTS